MPNERPSPQRGEGREGGAEDGANGAAQPHPARPLPLPPPQGAGDTKYRNASPEDAPALAQFAARSFTETFAHLYPREDLDAFLAVKFGAAQQRAEIEANHVRLALAGDDIVGFCFSGALDMDVPARDAAALELHRLYVAETVKGVGVAHALMDDAIAWARAQGADALYLSVWEDNIRAQRFYRRYGFEHVGEHGFMVGATRDNDFIWRLDLRR